MKSVIVLIYACICVVCNLIVRIMQIIYNKNEEKENKNIVNDLSNESSQLDAPGPIGMVSKASL